MAKMIEIPEPFFEHLLNCLANQKYVGEPPPNADAVAMGQEAYDELQTSSQSVIDDAWRDGMDILLGNPFLPRSAVLKNGKYHPL